MSANEITRDIIGCAMRVRTALTAGSLESTYAACLAHELRTVGLRVVTQVPIPITYGRSIGIIINFKVRHLRDGIRRMAMGEGWKRPSRSASCSSLRPSSPV